tara:strand:+ start:159 stop:347 length:189 start_codon:yes stop_codon:yes gene_type:complete
VAVLLLARRLEMVEQDTRLIYLESPLPMLVVVEEEEEVLEPEQLVLPPVVVVMESMAKIWME